MAEDYIKRKQKRTFMIIEARTTSNEKHKEDIDNAIKIMNEAIAKIESSTKGRVTMNTSVQLEIEKGNVDSIIF